MNPLISVKNLSISFESTTVVQHVSFEIAAGETVCLVGESGSGKSLSSRALMRLLPENSTVKGDVFFEENNIYQLDEHALHDLRGRNIAMIFQEPMSALNPVMTVGDQVREVFDIHMDLSKEESKNRVIDLFKMVKIPEPERRYYAYPFELSGGQRQRVMIAMALALRPKLLIADEPTTALDATIQKEILNLIKSLKDELNISVLLVTHDMGVVREIADRVIVMEQGRIRECGRVTEILDYPQHPYTQKLIAAMPALNRNCHAVLDTASVANKTPILSVKNLTKTYAVKKANSLFKKEKFTALNDVCVDLFPGEILGVVGESGSGKSTLAKCIAKLDDVDTGHLFYNGADITALSGKRLRNLRKHYVQMVFQDPYASLNPRMKIGDSLAEGLKEQGFSQAKIKSRITELLIDVGLEPDMAQRYPHAFSGGQRQRIGIARALAMAPRILIADEAVSALDVSIQKQVLDLLVSLKEKYGLSLLFISHDLRVISQICDRVVVMKEGKIVEQSTCQQMIEAPENTYTQKLLASVPGV